MSRRLLTQGYTDPTGYVRGPGMTERAENAYRVIGWSWAAASTAAAWLQNFKLGAFVTTVTALTGLVVWFYSRVRLGKSQADNQVWKERQELERQERIDATAAEIKIRLDAAQAELDLKERQVKAELKLRALQEAAEAKSLTAKVKKLERQIAEANHIIEQKQIEDVRRENHDRDRDRMLHEAQETISSLQERLSRMQGHVDHVEAKTDHVKEQADHNSRKIEAIEQSGPMPAVPPDEKAGFTPG